MENNIPHPECRRARQRAQHHQDAVCKCRNGEFRAVTGSTGELEDYSKSSRPCSPSSGHSPHRRVPLWAEQVPDQEQTGIQRSECHHHHRVSVQFDGRPVSTPSAGLQRELCSVICVECHRSLSDVLIIHGERGAGGQLVVDGLHYLLQTGRIHTIVVRRSLGGNILELAALSASAAQTVRSEE